MKNLLKISVVLITLISISTLIPVSGSDIVMATLIATIPAATLETINLSYFPQKIVLSRPGDLLQANALGDGVVANLDAAGLAFVNEYMKVGPSVAGYQTIDLADGIGEGRNTQITIDNPAGASMNVYAVNQRKGQNYVQQLMQTILANSGQKFKGFLYLSCDFGATDEINVLYDDGTVAKLTAAEIEAISLYSQDEEALTIDNTLGRIVELEILPTAQRTAYVTRFARMSNLSSQVNN